MLRRDSPTPREHMSERLWMRDRMTLLHSVCHHHEFVKTSHRGSHETCSPQVLTEPRLLSGSGVMGIGLRRPAPRSRSRATPFPVCEHCERTGRSRDRAAASPARYRDAARIAGAALEGVDLAEAIAVPGVFASTMTDGLVAIAETRKPGV